MTTKLLPILACSIFVLTACGGDKTNQNDNPKPSNEPVTNTLDSKQLAIEKISAYAASKGSSSIPSINDYKKAGVVGVTVSNIVQVNNIIAGLEKNDVDTSAEIKSVIANLELPDLDFDKDGIIDNLDNCPTHINPKQEDTDGDGNGDICDKISDTSNNNEQPTTDTDNDGLNDKIDNCPSKPNKDQKDTDKDGIGDACDDKDDSDKPKSDKDKDGINDVIDNCPSKPNKDQKDSDKDGIGDVCDDKDDSDKPKSDKDKDGINDKIDNCLSIPNKDQKDSDKDGIGDVCDDKDDNDKPKYDKDDDGIIDKLDNCPSKPNTDQTDSDNDGIGDVCDDNAGDDNEAVNITKSGNEFLINTSKAKFRLSEDSMSLSASVNGKEVVKSISSTLELRGSLISVSPPSESSTGNNWVEFRGWYSQDDNLWYVARYRFWPNKPFVHLTFSFTDRQDDHPTESIWSNLWDTREISDFKVFVDTDAALGNKNIVQENAYSGGDPINDPKIEEVTFSGRTHWRQSREVDGVIQLEHAADTADKLGETHLKIFPKEVGTFSLKLKQKPLNSPYPAANKVKVVVKHLNGTKEIIVDQGQNQNDLGSFSLDNNSFVQIFATGEDGDRIVFETLELSNQNGTKKTVKASRVTDNVITTNAVSFTVNDFWKRFPIQAETSGKRFTLTTIKKPKKFVGGVGYTVDMGINLDPQNNTPESLQSAVQAPPKTLSFPSWWNPLDGVITKEALYTQLMDKTSHIIRKEDEVSNNYGWMNWGDYQIGNSYNDRKTGKPTEDWGALQYDLSLGLILSWMQTKDPYLWNRGRASVRSAMDIQIAKFEPYGQKISGGGIRKGSCVENYHWCHAPIPEFNYHTRSLLLYSHLTGEQWPKDIAQMVIDNSAYFSFSRQDWTVTHARVLAWSLRNLVYGAKVFPKGTKYMDTHEGGSHKIMAKGTSYKQLLNTLVSRAALEIKKADQLPIQQPVWGGQIIEGLIIAYESGLLDNNVKTETYDAIKISLKAFINKQLRSDGKGGYEMSYYIERGQWADAATYGWFWVNNLAWATQNIPTGAGVPDYKSSFKNLYEWEQKLFLTKYHYIRAWTGVMGFGSYAASVYDDL